MNRLSIVIPVLNEQQNLKHSKALLTSWQALGHEVIVVDGGSRDDSIDAAAWADAVVLSVPGRAQQMNTGAKLCSHEWIWFLHVDTVPPSNALALINSASQRSNWGSFNVRLSGQHFGLRVIERMMNWRSYLSSINTGDQAIFINRVLFEAIGGFASIPLMEDIELCKRLKVLKEKPIRIRTPVTTSSRKWEQNGLVRTVWLMWTLRWQYARGVAAEKLVKQYYP